MKNLKNVRNILFGIVLIGCGSTFAQEEKERLDDKIDELTYKWDLEADKLASYGGLYYLCSDKAYRSEIFTLLSDIHHYDTILYDILIDLSGRNDDKEIQRTLRDIEKFENQYDTENFIEFMREECKAMFAIEKNSDDTRNEVGITSYSGQVYLLENELFKFVKQATNRVDKIREHIHHLNVDY